MEAIDPLDEEDSSGELNLGGVYRSLRGELGSSGASLVSIAFEQHTSLSPTSESEYDSTVFSRRFVRAAMDFDGMTMVRAELNTGSLANELKQGFELLRQDDQYLYSVDGQHFGAFEGDPGLFNLAEFEGLLDQIRVRNLTVEQVRDHKEGVSADTFDVELDAEGFVSLVRIFGDAVTASDEHSLDSFTVHIAASGDLMLDYWWKTTGQEAADEPGEPPYDCYISCHVTLRLAPMEASPLPVVTIDKMMATVKNVDSIWALTRK